MTQIARCGLNHNPIEVLLRPFKKPLICDNKFCLVVSTSSKFNWEKVKEPLRKLGMHLKSKQSRYQ